MALEEVVDAIMAAECALARAAKQFPDKGSCAVRAVIDVERGNLKASRRHVMAARASLKAQSTDTSEGRDHA